MIAGWLRRCDNWSFGSSLNLSRLSLQFAAHILLLVRSAFHYISSIAFLYHCHLQQCNCKYQWWLVVVVVTKPNNVHLPSRWFSITAGWLSRQKFFGCVNILITFSCNCNLSVGQTNHRHQQCAFFGILNTHKHTYILTHTLEVEVSPLLFALVEYAT